MHRAPPQTTFRPASWWVVTAGTVLGLVMLAGAILRWLEPSIPSGFVALDRPAPLRLPSWAVIGSAMLAVAAGVLRFAVAPRLVPTTAEAASRLATLASSVAQATLLVGALLFVCAELIRIAPPPSLP